jgi:hypothetical protein
MPDPFAQPRDPNVIQVAPSTPSDADIASAQARLGESAINDMTSQWMNDDSANRFQDGGRYQDGTPALTGPALQLEASATEYAPQQEYAPISQAPGTEDFRVKYGRSENEKGEIRRQYEAQVAALAAQNAELSARLSLAASQPVPQYGYAPQPPAAPYNAFPDRDPNEPLTIGDWNRIAQEQVDPALNRIFQQTQAVKQEAVSAAYRQFGGFDVSPVEEAAVYADAPSLRLLPPTERDRTVLQLAHARRLTTQSQASTFQNTPQIVPSQRAQNAAPVMIDPRRVMRQQTYVETASPSQANSPVEPLTDEAKQMRMNAELANAKTSKEMEVIVNKWFPGSIRNDDAGWPGRAASR